MSEAQLPLDFASARRSDPETSHLAAAAAKKIGGRHQLVLELLAQGPATDFELAEKGGLQQTSIGKRRGECRDALLVREYWVDGKPVRRATPSGALAQVWCITARGEAQRQHWRTTEQRL